MEPAGANGTLPEYSRITIMRKDPDKERKTSSLLRRPKLTCRLVPGVVAAACLMLSEASYAYVDPATGSMILQGLLAGIAIAIGVMRGYWERFRSFFSRSRQPANNESSQDRNSGCEESNLQSRS
jgi:hypothetical protein